MKKDNGLESAFNEYFETAKAPDESVTDGAKNYIRQPKGLQPALRRAFIAAACALSACASGIGLYFAPAAMSGIIDRVNDYQQAQRPSPPQINYYDGLSLTRTERDVYSEKVEGLNFLGDINLANNCSVNSLYSYSSEDGAVYSQAALSATVNARRHETVIYAEYTDGNTACELFREYYGGESNYYRGNAYLKLQTEENGEYAVKIKTENNGIKYYLYVISSDENAYTVWLDLIFK